MRKRNSTTAIADIETVTQQVVDLLTEREQHHRDEQVRQRLLGGPCCWCGMGSTRADRGWSRSGDGLVCGRCHDWFTDTASTNQRDLCAAVLVGISTDRVRRSPPGLADAVGLVPWNETGATEPNSRPWAHLDVAQMRSVFRRLAPGRWSIPARWSADAVVVW
jgi:hypothetical protein